MTASTGTVGRHRADAAATIGRFARFDLVAAGTSLLVVAVLNAVAVRSALLWIVPVSLTVLAIALVLAVRCIDAERTLAPIGLIATGNWFVAVVVPIALPFLWPVMTLVIVMPLVLAAPFVPLRALGALIAGAASVVATAAVIGLGYDDAGAIPDIVDELELVVVVAALAAMMLPIALVVWQNHRSQQRALDDALALNEGLDAARRHLAKSRRRIVQSGDAARRRLERDLHDGAQQRLVALGMKARAAHARVAGVDAVLAEPLADVVAEIDHVVDELRELARGISPPLIEAHGIVAALDDVARRSGPLVNVDSDSVRDRRFDPAVELALYFVALEALTNVAKHAPGATAAISLTATADAVAMVVHDDGPGFDIATTSPNGLANMRDRIEAHDGTFDLVSGAGAGTTVRVTVPFARQT